MESKYKMVNTVRIKDVWEVFEEISEASSRKAKLDILKENANRMCIRDVLQGTFDPRVKWLLPEGIPPYTPQAEGPPAPKSLVREHLNFKYFAAHSQLAQELDTIRRERMFIDLLESVDPRDAAILVTMINKKKPEYDGLTLKLVKEAIPNLIPD